MAYTPFRGTGGGVRTAAGNTAFVGITSWSLNKQVATVETTNFESTADGNGVVWKTFLYSLGEADGSFEGIFNGDTTNSEATIPIGTTIVLDLLFAKGTPYGYIDLSAIITGFQPKQALADKGTFTATFKVTGFPAVAA